MPKGTITRHRRLAAAIDMKMSKQALIDILIAQAEPGETNEEEIAATLTTWAKRTLAMRNDRPVDLVRTMWKIADDEADYLAKRGRFAEVGRANTPEEDAVVEKIKAMPPEEREKQPWNA